MNDTKKHSSLKITAIIVMIVLITVGIIALIAGMMQFKAPQPSSALAEQTPTETAPEEAPVQEQLPPEPEKQPEPPEIPAPAYEKAQKTDATTELDLQVYSENVMLIDFESNTVICEKNADAKIYPASMTKVLTLLTAVENIENWDDRIRITQEMIDSVYLADLTMAGFLDGEQVKPLDLLYGVILPSGAEATAAIAKYVAGSEEAFAELMNQKAAALGLTDSHFVDASGLHNEAHYCTLSDLAIVMRAALDNEICREILSSVTYTSEPTEQNPDGVLMTNKFLARVEMMELEGAKILCAKTGYTAEAGNCCMSFGASPSGRECICVTANAIDFEFTLADHIALYSTYAD